MISTSLECTVKPALKTNCISRPPAYKDHILQVPPKVYTFHAIEPSYKNNLYISMIKTIFCWSIGWSSYTSFTVIRSLFFCYFLVQFPITICSHSQGWSRIIPGMQSCFIAERIYVGAHRVKNMPDCLKWIWYTSIFFFFFLVVCYLCFTLFFITLLIIVYFNIYVLLIYSYYIII